MHNDEPRYSSRRMKRSWLRASLGMVAGMLAALAFVPAVFAEGNGGLLGGALAPVTGLLGGVLGGLHK